MIKVAVIQSNYLPWKGYFDIIHDVDQFVFYDDVQYTKNDWRNRNKVKTVQGLQWLTIPVGSQNSRLICEVEITDTHWTQKHWETIKQSYSKSAYFGAYKDFFAYFYNDVKYKNLSELNQYLIQHICREYLGIQIEFLDSRIFHLEGEKLDRLIDLLKKVGANNYVSGPTARDYIDESEFARAGIELCYKDYSGYPEYPQLFPPFEHAVSILDLLFNCGPDSPYYIWGWREEQSLSEGFLRNLT
jgi:WbqC-like protein family